MSNFEERRTIEEISSSGPRPPLVRTPEPVVIVEESQGMSGLAIAVIVAAAIAATTLIVYLIVSNQQQSQSAQQAKDQTAQTQAAQAQNPPLQQPPVIVTVPQSQPAAAAPAVPPPASAPISSSAASTDNAAADLNSKLLHDSQLGSYTINANVDNGVATLSGVLPSDDLKMRAEQVAKSVRGVSVVINHIDVTPRN